MKKLIALFCLFIAMQATATAAPLQLLSPPINKPDAATKAAVEQLLNAKWDRDATNQLDSESIFSKGPRDKPAVLIAYVLNRINHSRIDQALKVASDSRLRFKQNWDGRFLEVWLLTLTDQYDSAIVQMRSFKKQLDIAEKNNRLPAKVTQDLYKRFGRLIGYLEGPVAEKVNPQLLADTTVLLEQNIAPETQRAFSLARQAVKADYDQLVAEQVAYQNRELVKVAAANDVEKQRLEKDDKQAQETRDRLLPELEKIRNEGYEITNRLEQQINTAQGNLRSINQTGYSLEQDLAFLYTDLLNIDPRNLASAYAIENQIYRLELELSQQRIAAANQAGALNGLQNELFTARQSYQRQINQAKGNLKQVEVSQKRTGKKLQKLSAGPKIAGGKRQSLTSRRTALKTYDKLPLELYRQEMLEAVR